MSKLNLIPVDESLRVSPEEQARRDSIRLKILMDERQNPQYEEDIPALDREIEKTSKKASLTLIPIEEPVKEQPTTLQLTPVESSKSFMDNVGEAYSEAAQHVQDTAESATAHGEGPVQKTLGGLAGITYGLTGGMAEGIIGTVEKTSRLINSSIYKALGSPEQVDWKNPKATKALFDIVKQTLFRDSSKWKSFEAGEAAAGLPLAILEALEKQWGPEAKLTGEIILSGLGARAGIDAYKNMVNPKSKPINPPIDETPNLYKPPTEQLEMFPTFEQLTKETQDKLIKRKAEADALKEQEAAAKQLAEESPKKVAPLETEFDSFRKIDNKDPEQLSLDLKFKRKKKKDGTEEGEGNAPTTTQETPKPDVMKSPAIMPFEDAYSAIGAVSPDAVVSTSGKSVIPQDFFSLIKTMSKKAMNNPIWKWYKWAEDTIKVYRAEQHNNKLLIRDHIKTLSELDNAKDGSMQNLIKTALKLEREKDSWFNGMQYHPDAATLRKAGMTDHEIGVYQALAKLENFQYSIEQAAAIRSNNPVPERVPGYLPHIWKGLYKAKFLDPNSNEHFLYAANSRRGLDSAVKALKEKMPNIKLISIEKPFFGDVDFPINSAKNIHEWRSILNILEKGEQQGFLAQLFEREKFPYSFHELDNFANRGNPKGLRGSDIAKMFETTFDAVNTFDFNTKVANNIWGEMNRKGLLKNKYLNELVLNRAKNATGNDKNYISDIDNFFRKSLDKAGLNPDYARNLADIFTYTSTLYFLGWKIPFIVANSLQPFNQYPMLTLAKATLANYGHITTPSIYKAGKEFVKDWSTLKEILFDLNGVNDKTMAQLNKMKPLIKEMVKEGAIDPAALDMIAPTRADRFNKISGLDFAKKMEIMMRAGVYLQGHHFFNQMMKLDKWTDAQRIDAIHDFVNKTMVGYNKQFYAPTILSKFGLGGNALSLFATYNIHEGAKFYAMGKGALGASSMKAKSLYLSAMMQQLSIWFAFGGITALPFMADWDALINSINDAYNSNVPDSKTLAKLYTEKLPKVMQSIAMYGGPSTAADINFSGSMGSTGVSIPGSPAFEFAKDFVKALALMFKGTTTRGASEFGKGDDFFDVSKKGFTSELSPQYRGVVDNAFASFRERGGPYKIISETFRKSLGLDQEKYTVLDVKGTPKYEREPWEQRIASIGLTSLSETEVNRQHSVMNRIEARLAKAAKNNERALDEDNEFNKLSDTSRDILITELVDSGKIPLQSVINYYKRRNIDTSTSRILRTWKNQKFHQLASEQGLE